MASMISKLKTSHRRLLKNILKLHLFLFARRVEVDRASPRINLTRSRIQTTMVITNGKDNPVTKLFGEEHLFFGAGAEDKAGANSFDVKEEDEAEDEDGGAEAVAALFPKFLQPSANGKGCPLLRPKLIESLTEPLKVGQ